MNCTYCGVAFHPGAARCTGCGAHTTAPLAEPAGTASGIYEQIGRAVVNRQPNETLDRLIHIGERENASTREQKVARWAKVLFGLFVLWHFPFILIPIFSIGLMFFLWVYLPYRGVKAVLGWLSG